VIPPTAPARPAFLLSTFTTLAGTVAVQALTQVLTFAQLPRWESQAP